MLCGEGRRIDGGAGIYGTRGGGVMGVGIWGMLQQEEEEVVTMRSSIGMIGLLWML